MKGFLAGSLFLVLLSGCGSASTFLIYGSNSASSGRSAVSRGKLRLASSCDGCSGSPETMILKIYAVYLSTHEDCSSPILVVDNGSTPVANDLSNNPVLIQASPPDGDYPCMILKISDNLTFRPDAEASAAFPAICPSNSDAVFDIYRTDSGDSWKDLDGNVIAPSGTISSPGDDTVFVFASTNVSALLTGPFAPDPNQTQELTGSLTVPGQATFYVDFSGGVKGDDDRCSIEGGNGMGFR